MRGGGIVNRFLPYPTLHYGDVVHFLGRQENEPKEAGQGEGLYGPSPWDPNPPDPGCTVLFFNSHIG